MPAVRIGSYGLALMLTGVVGCTFVITPATESTDDGRDESGSDSGALTGGSPDDGDDDGDGGIDPGGNNGPFVDMPICPDGMLAGSHDIEFDGSELADCTEITGNLNIKTPLPNLTLSKLSKIGGTLTVYDIETLELPALAEVGVDIHITYNDALTSLDLPALAKVGGTIRVGTYGDYFVPNAALKHVRLPELKTVGGIEIRQNEQLVTLELPKLEQTPGTLRITDNPKLTALDLPSLTSVGVDLDLNPAQPRDSGGDPLPKLGMPALERIALPALKHVGNNFIIALCNAVTTVSLPGLESVGYLSVRDNQSVAEIDLPNLATAVNLEIQRVGALETLTFPALTELKHGLNVTSNPLLTSVRVPKWTRTIGGSKSLYIMDNELLTELSLPSLSTLAGSLYVYGTSALSKLSFPALTATDSFAISGTSLTSVDVPLLATAGFVSVSAVALESLTLPSLTTARALKVEDNASLTTVNLPALASSGYPFWVIKNPRLDEFHAPALTTLTALRVTDNAVLTTWSLPALERGSFIIQDNPSLANMALPKLKEAGYTNVLTRNPLLKDVTLPALESLGPLAVNDCAALETLSLSALTSSGTIELANNPVLTTLDLPVLNQLAGVSPTAVNPPNTKSLSVHDNPELTAVDLPEVSSIGGPVSVLNNPKLTALRLPSVESIGGDVSLEGAAVTELAMPALTLINGNLTVTDTAALTSLSLHQLASISGDLTISRNAALTSLDAASLVTLEGALELVGNAQLPAVALPVLTEVHGAFNVSYNTAMTSLSAPLLITIEGADFEIIGNTKLPTAQADGLLGQLAGYNGSTTISGNLP